jgi:hypothetical protein
LTGVTHTGGCLCGGVRFEVDEPLGLASYCHCTRCQRRSGAAASANVGVPASALRVSRGGELVREWTPPDGGWPKAFCGACGGALWSRKDDGSHFGVRLGTFDADPGVRPSYRQFVAYAAAWEPIPEDGLTRFPERRTA